jgi:membrane dipeptidase
MHTPSELSPIARELVGRGVVFDAHVDAIGRAVDLGHDLGVRGPGHFDLVRAAEGGVGVWVSVLWVDPELYRESSFERAAEMLNAVHDLGRRHPNRFRLVGDAKQLNEARREGLIGGIASIEGGHAIEGNLEKLEWFFEYGVRGMTLVWNNHLPWIRSCQEGAGSGVPPGINEFGRQVVQSMNVHGMLVDVSHACERAFYDVIDASAAPVIASHSGCKALHDHPRNLTDDQLRTLARNRGVCGIVFHPGFLDGDARAEEARVRETETYLKRAGETEAERHLSAQEVMRTGAEPMPLKRLVEHIVHAVEIVGAEHVGLGSDFDGIERGPQGLEDATGYGVLIEALLQGGFTPTEVELIMGGNLRRVFTDVTGFGTFASLGPPKELDAPLQLQTALAQSTPPS